MNNLKKQLQDSLKNNKGRNHTNKTVGIFKRCVSQRGYFIPSNGSSEEFLRVRDVINLIADIHEETK